MNGLPLFYLASASPRRRALLEEVGLCFEVFAADIEERRLPGESPSDLVNRLARAKAERASKLIDEAGRASLPVLAADTCVTLDDRVLGKPCNRADAVAALELLSGRTHEVLTAVALRQGRQLWQSMSVTRVGFKQLTAREIGAYCDSGEPDDKAGSYGIQGRGSAFVNHLEGSYTGVVGLPLYETRCLLNNVGIDWL